MSHPLHYDGAVPYSSTMTTGEITTIVGFVAVVGFLWTLHRDVRALSDRVARLEGTVDTLKDFLVGKEKA